MIGYLSYGTLGSPSGVGIVVALMEICALEIDVDADWKSSKMWITSFATVFAGRVRTLAAVGPSRA